MCSSSLLHIKEPPENPGRFILSDGTSAQYGSDAIVGVTNILLRSDRTGSYIGSQVGLATGGDGALHIAEPRQGIGLRDRFDW